jgi:hypothetical protein
MKYLYFTITLFFFFSFSAVAQINSNYERGFKIGFKEGYCYNKTNYDCFTPLTPITPMPRINESRENYTEGYNRGFQYGLDLKRSNDALRNSDNVLNQKVISFNRYVPQNPVEAMRVVAMIKQQKYDARTEWIQQKIYQLTDLYNSLFKAENFPQSFDTYTHKNILRNIVAKYANTIVGYDFGDDYVFRNVQLEISNIEKYYYDYYNSIVSQLNQKLQKELIENASANINSQKLVNENVTFSSFLEKFYGKYICTISVYELINNTYVFKEKKNGKIFLESNIIKYGSNDADTYREFLLESFDNKTKEYIYKTEHGNVVIDFNFKKIIFYGLDNKNYWVYSIITKI